MSKVNVGKRTKAQEKKVADDFANDMKASGAEIVKDKSGATYAVTKTQAGLTISTRIG